MKDFTPCEHGSHPMGCIQCQLAVQPPATPQEPDTYGPFFDPCGKCVTRTHCAHHDRCLAECVPADLRASAPPAVWQDKTADELRRIAAHIRTPGHVWAEDAIDEIARLLENRARQLSPLPSPPTPGENR